MDKENCTEYEIPQYPYEGNEPYLYISYSHSDYKIIRSLSTLMVNSGFRIWSDDGIPVGDWDQTVKNHIEKCSVFICFISKNYLESFNTSHELFTASDNRKEIIPVYLEKVDIPERYTISLSRFQFVDAYDCSSSQELFDMILKYRSGIVESCRTPVGRRNSRKKGLDAERGDIISPPQGTGTYPSGSGSAFDFDPDEPGFPYEGNENYIFASYCRVNSEKVSRILSEMHRQGFRVWYDKALHYGVNWVKHVEDRILSCKVFICFVSKDYIDSDMCTRELYTAVGEGVAVKPNITIIPIKLEDVPIMPFFLRGINWISADDYPSVERMVRSMCMNGEATLLSCNRYYQPNGKIAVPADSGDTVPSVTVSSSPAPASPAPPSPPSQPQKPLWKKVLPFAVACVIIAALVGALLFKNAPASPAPVESTDVQAVLPASTPEPTESAAAPEPEATAEEPDIKEPVESAAISSSHLDAKGKAAAYLRQKLEEQSPMQTFETDEPSLSNAAYSYDSAVSALAFISENDLKSAQHILDTFVAGISADSEYNDRIRNAYMSGNAGALPGYWSAEAGSWLQDAYQVGTSTCATSAAAVALLTYNAAEPNFKYVDTAKKGIDWILDNCSDSNPGYSAGYDGWPKADNATIYTTKGTLDNLWLYSACRMLAEVTGSARYSEAAEKAYSFVKDKMYSSGDSRFFEGTDADGISPNTGIVTVDAQCMAYLVLGDDSGLDNVNSSCKSGEGGFAYDNTREGADGFWVEGTAMAALSYALLGESDDADRILSVVEAAQLPSGGFPEASVPDLPTGDLAKSFTGMPRIASCAWYIMAASSYNPFS